MLLYSLILNVTAAQYTCSLNGVYCPPWLVQWSCHCSHMCIPVHSLWLPGYINVIQTVLILTMSGLFPDRPCKYVLLVWLLFSQDIVCRIYRCYFTWFVPFQRCVVSLWMTMSPFIYLLQCWWKIWLFPVMDNYKYYYYENACLCFRMHVYALSGRCILSSEIKQWNMHKCNRHCQLSRVVLPVYIPNHRVKLAACSDQAWCYQNL